MNRPLTFKGLSIRTPVILPIKGRGFANHGSTLGFFAEATSVGDLTWLRKVSEFRHIPEPLH